MGSPVVAKIQLGRTLRRLRRQTGRSREEAATCLDCDISKISRVEQGKGSLKTLEVEALLRLYESPEQRDQLVQIARDARRRTSYRVPDWARDFVGMEAEACELRTYEAELVPGLLQTEAYARAITLAANPERGYDEVEKLVGGRAERQARLTSDDNPPQVFAVINEAVIRRIVGGPKVMQDQLTHLLKLSELPTVELHILPFTSGAHAAMSSSFVLLDLPDPAVRIAYIEDLESADYLDEPPQVDRYSLVFDRLLGDALGSVQTVEMIEEVRQHLT